MGKLSFEEELNQLNVYYTIDKIRRQLSSPHAGESNSHKRLNLCGILGNVQYGFRNRIGEEDFTFSQLKEIEPNRYPDIVKYIESRLSRVCFVIGV